MVSIFHSNGLFFVQHIKLILSKFVRYCFEVEKFEGCSSQKKIIKINYGYNFQKFHYRKNLKTNKINVIKEDIY